MTNNNQLAAINADAQGNDGIVFDLNAGISEEEQREILSKINGIAEKNRRSLSEAAEPESAAGTGSKSRFKAKKSGGLFPILVNTGAVILLAGGFLLLYSFQGKTDIQVREGTMVYNSAERALIEEIRKETESRIAAKEQEIALIVSKLEGVDEELRELYSSNQELSAEQLAVEDRLRSLQAEYRSSLIVLQDERSSILEDSRSRETSLRAQLEARIRELAAASERNESALSSARSELEWLSREQEKAAAIEAQLGGSFAVVNGQILKNQLAEALETLRVMRDFLNTPAFQAIRSIQARKDLYAQAIDSMEAMVEETRRNQVSGQPSGVDTEQSLTELMSENARLEENIAGLTRTIEAVNSQGSGLTLRLTELESQAADLRTANSELQTRAASLETERTSLTQTVAARDNTITELRSQNAARDNTISELRSQNAARDNTINELRSQNTVQSGEITNLNNQLTTIRQALQALSQDQ
jgi:chromosome segregation ATPase